MMRKIMVALLATAALSMLAPDIAAARGGGGGGGHGGGGFGGGGGHGGGGFGGGGRGFGGGGGFHGGGFAGGGFRGGGFAGGGVHPAMASGFRPGMGSMGAVNTGAFRPGLRTAAIAGGAGFVAGRHFGHFGRFDGRFRHNRRFFFVGVGPFGYYDDYYPYYDYPDYAYDDSYYGDGGCYVVRQRVLTTYGWRVRPVQVCG